MIQQDPQYFELDPEKAPRTTAVILIICGLMGLGFMLVNVVFTGEDPYQTENWPEEDGPIQDRADIMPNLVRGKAVDGVSPEEEGMVAREEEKRAALVKKKKAAATTAPFQFQYGNKPAGTGEK